MPTSPRSGKPGSRWVTMPNGTHVLMDGQGNPTSAVWRERLSGDLPATERDPVARAYFNGTGIMTQVLRDPDAADESVSPIDALDQALVGVVGHPVEYADLAALAGAPDGSKLRVWPQAGDDFGDAPVQYVIDMAVDHPLVEVQGRRLFRDGDQVVLSAEALFLKDNAPAGMGTHILARMVDAAARVGVDRIDTDAERGPNVNGYYTWPRLGYDGPIPFKLTKKLPKGLRTARWLSDLMKTQQGRDWWKANGESVELSFDPRPGSPSRQVLDAYMQAKGWTKAALPAAGVKASTPTGAVWRTIRGTPVLIGGDGRPVSAEWQSRLSGTAPTLSAADEADLVRSLSRGYSEPFPAAMLARRVTTTEEQRAAAAKRLDSAYEAAKRVKPLPDQQRVTTAYELARAQLTNSEADYLDSVSYGDLPDEQAGYLAKMRADRAALEKAQTAYLTGTNANAVMDAINRHRPPGTEADSLENMALLAGQKRDSISPTVDLDVDGGQLWLSVNLSTAALKDRITRHNWDGSGTERPGLPPVTAASKALTVGGSFLRATNEIHLNANPDIDPDMARGTYVHEMTHWLSDTPRGIWAQGAVYDRATGSKGVATMHQDSDWRMVASRGGAFSQPYAGVGYQYKVGRRWLTGMTETASTAVADLYRDPYRLAQEDRRRFKLAVALLWGDDASLDSLIQPPKAAPKRRKKDAAWWLWTSKGHAAPQGDDHGVPYPDPARGSRVQPDDRPVDGRDPRRGPGPQRGLYLRHLLEQGRADERLAAGLPGRPGAPGDGDRQHAGAGAGGGVLKRDAAAGWGLKHGRAWRAAHQAGSSPKSGTHWVTMNGTHVLIGGNGQPVSPTWQARLQRKPKVEGGPPVGLDNDPAHDPKLAGLRDAVAQQYAQDQAAALDQTLAEARTTKALVEGAGLSREAAQEQARWENMPFDKSDVLGDPNRHVNVVLVVDGHDAAGAPMLGVFKGQPDQDGATMESSLAYYGLDQLLGTGVVPPTVLRTVDAKQVPDMWSGGDEVQGTLQRFVPGFEPAETYAPKRGVRWQAGSENEVVRYAMGRTKDGLNGFQRKVIAQHPENSQRLQAAMVLDTLMGNKDRHNENWGLDGDGRLWLTDNDTGAPYTLSEEGMKGDRLTMSGVRSFMKNDAQGFAIPKPWLKRWKAIKRSQFDAALSNLDGIQEYGLHDTPVDRDQIWDNLQALVKHGRIDGEDTFGDPVVEMHFP